jgi:ribosome-associated protein
MIRITPSIWIEESELEESFIRSSGAGGQNIQKVETAVQLKFNPAASPRLPGFALENLKKLAGRRMGKDGVLTLTAQRFRTQERNRDDARERLAALLREAVKPPPPVRRATKPGKGAVRRRLDEKTARAKTKQQRRTPGLDG